MKVLTQFSPAGIFLVGIFFAIDFQGAITQLSEDEIPAELRYILHSDLEEWQPPEDISAMFPYYLSGFDSENRPIWIVEAGKWDVRGIIERGEQWGHIFDKYVDKFLWRLWNSTKIETTMEKPVKDGILIVDFDGLGHAQLRSPAATAYFLKKLRIVATALPLAHGVYIVNANFVAKNVMNLARPVIGKDFHRVNIFGTNPNSYRPFLLKLLPKDQLPQSLGGDKDFKPIESYG